MSGILTLGDKQAIQKQEQSVRARKLVDSVLKHRGAERWIATRKLWFYLYGPIAWREHNDAVAEAKQIRADLLDKKFGRTLAAQGKDPTQAANNNTTLRIVALVPEELNDFLIRFDPLNLGRDSKVTKKHSRDNWREVYKTFPEYVVVEKI